MASKEIRIRPKARKKFDRREAEDVIRRIVLEELEGRSYESGHGGELTRKIIRRIHDAVGSMLCDRYKFCVHVLLGERQGQGLKCAGGCLWDDDTDCLASTSLGLDTLYCVATVFAIFCYHYD